MISSIFRFPLQLTHEERFSHMHILGGRGPAKLNCSKTCSYTT